MKVSVAVPSNRQDNTNSQSTALDGGNQILLKIQKEGLFNFKHLSAKEEETKEKLIR